MKKFKLALIQINSSSNLEDNYAKIEKMVNDASKKAELIILPEHADAIGKRDADFEQDMNGKTVSFFSNLAKQNNVYLHLGSFAEKGAEGKPFNTSVLFSPNGEVIAKYSKLHLFDVDLPDGTGVRESNGATAGDEIVVADTELCKIGFSICYDVRFPELYRKMVLMGAELLVVSANFTHQTGKHHWEPLLRARAIENGCFVAAVNQCGENEQFKAYGHSMLVDPWGNIISQLDEEEDILYAEIDPSLLTEARSKIPSLQNRRTDIY